VNGWLAAPVNDAPTFTAGPATVTVAEDSGAYSAAWATNISAGPGESDPLAFTVNCSATAASLFEISPAINISTGRLTFTPAANMFGSVSCTVTLVETTPDGLSDAASLIIVVTAGELCVT
jgi:hypothetical protein